MCSSMQSMWGPEVDVRTSSLTTFPPYLSRQSFSLNRELAFLTSLAGQQPRLYPSGGVAGTHGSFSVSSEKPKF